MLKTKTKAARKTKRQPPEDVLTRALAAARNAIRDKNRALKMGQIDRDEMLEKNLAPVVGPLKQLVDQTTQREPEHAAAVRTPLVAVKRKLADTAQHPDPQKRVKLSQSAKIAQAAPRFQPSEDDDDEMDNAAYDRIITQVGPSRIDESATPQRSIPGALRGRLISREIIEPSDEEIFESPAKMPDQEPGFLMTPEVQEAALKIIDAEMGPLTRHAFKSYLFKKEKMDLIYGVRYDGDNWKMGNKIVKISEDDDMALMDPHDETNYIEFQATPGLMDLIMYKEPHSELWTQEDLKMYKKILEFTNAHRRLWRKQEQLKGSSGTKWTNVIKPLVEGKLGPESDDSVTDEASAKGAKKKISSKVAGKPKKKKTGGSIPKTMLVTGNEIDYIPFRDPNQLVERLEKLVAEHDAGHTGHNNEIVAIAAALRRAEIIE